MRVRNATVNTLFPGSIKRVHKSAFGAHQLENIGFVLKCLSKMGMKDDELFEPIDLHEKKNMMKVFRCMHSFASIVSGSRVRTALIAEIT